MTVYSARITRSDELTRPPLQLLTHYRTDSKPVPHLSPRTDARCHYTAANATNGARLRARPSRAGNVGKVGTRENPIDARRKMDDNSYSWFLSARTPCPERASATARAAAHRAVDPSTSCPPPHTACPPCTRALQRQTEGRPSPHAMPPTRAQPICAATHRAPTGR